MHGIALPRRAAPHDSLPLAGGHRRLSHHPCVPTSPCPPPPSLSAGSVALVDVRSRTWPLLYANAAFARDEGGDTGDVEACTAAGFWELFEPVEVGEAGRRRQQPGAGACSAAGCGGRLSSGGRLLPQLPQLA